MIQLARVQESRQNFPSIVILLLKGLEYSIQRFLRQYHTVSEKENISTFKTI